MVNCYPDDGGTYGFVDHFLKQTTSVNTNATVFVSIDGGQLIPMTYYGIISELVPDNTAVRDWYTWQVTISALTEPGIHTFQFFEHYYVWQDEDQYWADFNAQSTIKSFIIPHSLSTPSQSTSNSSNPHTLPPSQALYSECQTNTFSSVENLHAITTAIIMINIVAVVTLTAKKQVKRME